MEVDDNRLDLNGVSFKYLDEEDNRGLEDKFLMEEIREAIWSCDLEKTPGLDRYSMEFFKCGWNFLKKDIMEFIEEFHTKDTFLKAIIVTFIALIPKIKESCGKSSFEMPNCIYSGESDVRWVVVEVNEIVDFARRSKKECFLFKVDFTKAYNYVLWDFLRFMLRRMGFGSKWRLWTEACIFSTSYLVLVNGNPTKEFRGERGLKQDKGIPLSRYNCDRRLIQDDEKGLLKWRF
ncbi:uncharacterized protein LOC131628904 [Vicia villosa]|uniref:uncharacterized protein LOC131628904 n=1 Tax=Vicia villosa TaxID=3911 RepID=UPI00273B73E9|nr:uncharacterized protein LOC131628904 [Vicia villosa]